MTNTKTYADSFSTAFEDEGIFMAFLRERNENGIWTTKHAKDLRIAPLEENTIHEVEPAPGYSMDDLKDILADTMENTQLMLKTKDLTLPIRSCAVKTLLDRAKISGTALGKVEKPVLARILNHCLRVAKGEALLRIADGKISAVHGGDSSDYSILEMPELFSRTVKYLNDNFAGCTFVGGFYDHSSATAAWELKGDMLIESYKDALTMHDVAYSELVPAVRLSTSDVGVSGANLYPTLYMGKRSGTISLGSPLSLEHRGEKNMRDFDDMLGLLYSQYQLALGNLTKLLDVDIDNPVNCMLGICKRIGVGKKLAYEAAEQFKAQYGEDPCTAHDIYYGISEIVWMVTCGGATGTKIVKTEETVAKALSVRWENYDIPGIFKW